MTLFKVVLRAYQGYTKPYLSSTTIAGGIVYGMVISNSLQDIDVVFSTFVAKNYKLFHLGRIYLNRITNKTEPFLYNKIISNGQYYVEFEGYARAKDERELREILSKYSYYIGNNFTFLKLKKFRKWKGSR
ncbi:hypothetical protein [Sulfolobus sp. E11-6]|uniref:hypothetical protein n=1 Tax=Sulfolobus sp. E11-6 TaxID=2663020 RepID=UPI0012967537|nr:hypothetical protein [Sulfolobus sp. E11-6]QGA68932.1 hypothetical protein GFS33_09580 [Sulfolobus sp. E11-6]